MIKKFLLIFFIASSTLFGEEQTYFDPLQVAKEETAAWKDYYNSDITGMVQHISQLVIVQFRLNNLTAWTSVIPKLIEAAREFKNLPHTTTSEEYDQKVLPYLVEAYDAIRVSMNGHWDAHQAAKDELTWWIYRRSKNMSNPEIVGNKIADLYKLIYGSHDDHHFQKSGYLRAVAARFRDMSQDRWHRVEESDWIIIEHILSESYKELLMGIKNNVLQN